MYAHPYDDTSPVSNLSGQQLGHYKVLEPLGAGGMGVVYRAQDTVLGRMVALKVLPATSSTDPEAVSRFKREARTASSLNHPNICTIYGFDDLDGRCYLAMELLEGETLDRRLLKGPLEPASLIDVATQLAPRLVLADRGGFWRRWRTTRSRWQLREWSRGRIATTPGPVQTLWSTWQAARAAQAAKA